MSVDRKKKSLEERTVRDSRHYSSSEMKNHRRGKDFEQSCVASPSTCAAVSKVKVRRCLRDVPISEHWILLLTESRSRLLLTHARFLTRAVSYKSRKFLTAATSEDSSVEAARGYWSICDLVDRTRKGKKRQIQNSRARIDDSGLSGRIMRFDRSDF